MIKIVFVKNPFSPQRERTVKISEFKDKRLSFYLDDFVKSLPDNSAWIQIDGKTIEAEYQDLRMLKPKENTFIVVMPKVQKGGKSILGLIATIALSIGASAVGAAYASTAGVWGATSYAAAAAVMFVGGLLINKFIMPKQDLKYNTEDNDPTYSWNGIQTMDGQGNGIAITYGKVKSGGQSLVKFTSNNGDDQYFNWLVAAGEGPLDSITDIKLNSNPISNYEEVSMQTRLGTNDQSIIPYFNDTVASKMFSYEVNNNEWRTDVTEGNSAEGLIIEVECSNGLYHANDNGSLGNAWVQVSAQYQKVGTSTWTTFVNNQRITGKKASTVRKQFRVDNIATGQYNVRVTVTARSASVSSSRDSVRIWWTTLSTIVYDDFTYPNIALLGIKAKATSQLSGSTPQLTFIKERKKVWVWGGTAYVQKNANNPAWACYDFIHGATRLKNINTGKYEFEVRGVSKELMLYDQFKDWAEFCDNMKLYINIEVTQVKDFWSVVNSDLAPVGRGLVLQFGTKFGCIYSHSSTPVQLFNMGNIVQGSFQLDYMALEERANAVEINFINAEQDYEKDTVTVYADNYDSLDLPNQATAITLNGITSYSQAYREGKFQLKCNEKLRRTVSFKADVEAIGCMVGDVILVAHDVPQWSISGRVLSAEQITDNMINITSSDGSVIGKAMVNVPIDMDEIDSSVKYAMMIRKSIDNSITTYDIKSITGEYGNVNVVLDADMYLGMVSADDLFCIGKVNVVAKPFTVQSITRSSELERTVTALEYVEGVYEENYDIPIPDYSLATDNNVEKVQNLQARQISYRADESQVSSIMFVSWQYSQNADSFSIYLSTDNINFKLTETVTTLSAEINTQPYTEYYVRVVAVRGMKQSDAVTIGPVNIGVDELPPDVSNVNSRRLPDGTTFVWWDFTYPYPNDIKGFEVRWSIDSTAVWEDARALHNGVVTSQPFETSIVANNTGVLLVKAVDNSGQYSQNAARLVVNLGDVLQDNVVWSYSTRENNWENVTHNAYVDVDGSLRGMESAAMWDNSGAVMWHDPETAMWDATFEEISLSFDMELPATGRFWIEFEANSLCWLEYAINDNSEGSFKPNISKTDVKLGDHVYIRVASKGIEHEAIISDIRLYVDVADRTENFIDLEVPADGLELPIQTPNYFTTGVRVEEIIYTDETTPIEYELVTSTPAVVKFYKVERGASLTRTPVAVKTSIIWQGFSKEVDSE